MSMATIAGYTRHVSASMTEVLQNDYIRTARAKGLLEKSVLWRHALKNALIPVVTIIALDFGSLFSGALITETMFSWLGMGKTIYAAIITESKSQKGIILGKQGSMIKAIGTAARKELEREFSQKVNLQLWVKANKNWTNDINKLKKFGLCSR